MRTSEQINKDVEKLNSEVISTIKELFSKTKNVVFNFDDSFEDVSFNNIDSIGSHDVYFDDGVDPNNSYAIEELSTNDGIYIISMLEDYLKKTNKKLVSNQ